MAKAKTTTTNVSVADFVDSFVDREEKRADTFQLIKLMKKWSGFEPKMWGPSIIGFGSYHYKYASGHEGDAPIIAFAPRKPAFSLYVHSPTKKTGQVLEKLGKFKIAKACIYVKKLSDINLSVLEIICRESIKYINEHHECGCREK
jgi:hypothetical protein